MRNTRPNSVAPINIGSRRELVVDDYVIERMHGNASRRLHRPTPREVAMVTDAPWEGNMCGHFTVFQDGDLYRMYYTGRQVDLSSGELRSLHMVVCYAESSDGIHWSRPELGLVEFEGSKKNNIILDGARSHHFTPFKDANPDCRPEAKYKAFGGDIFGARGMFAFQSPDGIRWSLVGDHPVIIEGRFDSQNLAFWDSTRGHYREYHRHLRDGRDIMTSTFGDFAAWTEPVFLEYSPGRLTQLYTNQITPYYRAPHLFLGFPTRYNTGRGLLTPLNERIARVSEGFGRNYTDGGFMSSRDGLHFDVWDEAFIRPGPVEKGSWLYGSNYQNWGIVETESHIPGTPNELSVYACEGGWEGTSKRLRRHTLRIDGFVSIQAPLSGGELVTRPIVFEGNELAMNVSTSAAGSVRVEIQQENRDPIRGFALSDCPEIFGDAVEQQVCWRKTPDVAKLSGRSIRLRFVLQDADLYSFVFR